jgi:hypothetical protein
MATNYLQLREEQVKKKMLVLMETLSGMVNHLRWENLRALDRNIETTTSQCAGDT